MDSQVMDFALGFATMLKFWETVYSYNTSSKGLVGREGIGRLCLNHLCDHSAQHIIAINRFNEFKKV